MFGMHEKMLDASGRGFPIHARARSIERDKNGAVIR
jgi:hypothetical protein